MYIRVNHYIIEQCAIPEKKPKDIEPCVLEMIACKDAVFNAGVALIFPLLKEPESKQDS